MSDSILVLVDEVLKLDKEMLFGSHETSEQKEYVVVRYCLAAPQLALHVRKLIAANEVMGKALELYAKNNTHVWKNRPNMRLTAAPSVEIDCGEAAKKALAAAENILNG